MYAFHQTFSPILCLSSLTFTVKKEGFGGGGTRQLQFSNSGQGDAAFIKPSGKTLNVAVGPGLPPSTSMYILIAMCITEVNSNLFCHCVCSYRKVNCTRFASGYSLTSESELSLIQR